MRTGLKLWWMLFWRLAWLCIVLRFSDVLPYVALVSAVGSFLLVRVFRMDVQCFPIVRLLRRKQVISKLSSSTTVAHQYSPATHYQSKSTTRSNDQQPRQKWATPQAPYMGQTLARPSAKGSLTGYEPSILRSYHAPISIRANGVAGLGLFGSDFDSRSIHSGQRGEMGFYKVLCLEGLIDSFSSYWSVAMPADGGTAHPDTKFQTDIDCVIVQGNTMFLLDLKYYKSGDVTWHSPDGHWLLCRDNPTGQQVGNPRKMSRNMAMAVDRFPAIFPHLKVKSYVVLVPTQDGLGVVARGTAWPGGVELVNLPEMLTVIRDGGRGFADEDTDQKLMSLLKD